MLRPALDLQITLFGARGKVMHEERKKVLDAYQHDSQHPRSCNDNRVQQQSRAAIIACEEAGFLAAIYAETYGVPLSEDLYGQVVEFAHLAHDLQHARRHQRRTTHGVSTQQTRGSNCPSLHALIRYPESWQFREYKRALACAFGADDLDQMKDYIQEQSSPDNWTPSRWQAVCTALWDGSTQWPLMGLKTLHSLNAVVSSGFPLAATALDVPQVWSWGVMSKDFQVWH